jgi:dipeptide/tripeptide permease
MIYHTTGRHGGGEEKEMGEKKKAATSSLKMEQAFPSEIIVTIFWATWHQIQKTVSLFTLKMVAKC